MSNIVPFNQSAAPAYIGQVGMTAEQIKAMNAAAAIGTGGAGVDRISIKGSRFRLVLGGVAQAPLPFVELDVAVLRVNDGINKTWYATDWNPDADAGPPDCSSDDGVTPRSDSPKVQSATCATCPRNEWGSHINPTTGAKGKACQDSKRMAVMAPGADGRYATPTAMYQLAVPPASLKDFGMLVKGLAAHTPPAAYNMVVVTLSFDADASFPKLNFKPKRWLEQDEFTVVNGRYNDEETKRICGLAEAQGLVLGGQASAQAAPQQQVIQQQQPVVQQQAQPVEQPTTQQGWGGQQAQPVQQAQQPAAQQGWGGQQAQPVVQQQAQPGQQPVAQAGWGGEQAQPVTQQQPVVQQQAGAPARERGKPSNGRARRTKEEIAEDAAADARDQAAQGGQQQTQPVQQAAVQQPAQGGWGGEQAQPVATQQGWGGQQAAPVVQQEQPAAQTGWGGQQAAPVQQTGAPNQPNLAQPGDLAFAGWDD